MIHPFTKEEIEQQKQKVFSPNPSLELFSPCKINDGILRLNEEEVNEYLKVFSQINKPICFFIPASGSGSRMFQFLYEFLEKPNAENRSQMEHFMNSIEDFAFFTHLPKDIQQSIKDQTIDLQKLVIYLLEEEGLGFGIKPKGLIPFHWNKPFVLNPFQEHILQSSQFENNNFAFHFTIQESFKKEIESNIQLVENLMGSKKDISFSEQSTLSNSLTFSKDQELLLDENNEPITRPSGHGALLSNLNAVKEEIVFIKNIDNVQHFKKSSESIVIWKLLGGILEEYKRESKALFLRPTKEGLEKLNSKYQVYSKSEIEACKSEEDIKKILNRPIRVCGMVKNEGQPGGGPFWIKEKGIISKQIVEKAQISETGEQFRLMVQSTHFNPVMIAASTHSFEGQKFDLQEFKDASKYFIVNKDQQGQTIQFLELPGLWNGGMANWNTLFVEIPSSTFSPVKTVLDLLTTAHKE